MKAIWIKAAEGIVQEVEYTGGLKQAQAYVGGLIEVGRLFQGNHCLYIDEEGLFKGYDYGFHFTDEPDHIFVGNGLIVGDDGKGNDAPVALDVDRFSKRVRFITIEEEETTT